MTSAAPGPIKSTHHLAKALHPTPRVIKAAMGEVDGFNAKFAVLVTRVVGSMWCAYSFSVLALISLPAILQDNKLVPSGTFPTALVSLGLIALVAWIAQTFIQLVLLSVIMVGQNVQSIASDARAEKTYEDTLVIIDRLDVNTEGGLGDIRKTLAEIAAAVVPPAAGSNQDVGASAEDNGSE